MRGVLAPPGEGGAVPWEPRVLRRVAVAYPREQYHWGVRQLFRGVVGARAAEDTLRSMRNSRRVLSRLAAAGIAVVVLTGLGEPGPKFSLERAVGNEISAKGRPYRQYRTVRDDSRTLEVKVPKQWDEGHGASQFVEPGTGRRYGSGVFVSTNLDKFRNSFDVPGLRLTATTELPASVNELLDENSRGYDTACTGQGVKAYDDGRFEGNYEFFTKCDRTKTAAVAVAAISPRDGVFIIVAAQVRTRADLAAIDRAIRSVKLTQPS